MVRVFIAASPSQNPIRSAAARYPYSAMLQKFAQALDANSDYLMNGASDEAISAQLPDQELLTQFYSRKTST